MNSSAVSTCVAPVAPAVPAQAPRQTPAKPGLLAWLVAPLMAWLVQALRFGAWLKQHRRELEALPNWREVIPALLDAEAKACVWLQTDALALIRSDPEFADIRDAFEGVAPRALDEIVLTPPVSARVAVLRAQILNRAHADPEAAILRLARRMARIARAARTVPSVRMGRLSRAPVIEAVSTFLSARRESFLRQGDFAFGARLGPGLLRPRAPP